jgi:hypothetical protein
MIEQAGFTDVVIGEAVDTFGGTRRTQCPNI